MSNTIPAILCVDDDPFILQALNFQLNKIISSEKILFEFFKNPIEALIFIEEIETKNENINIECVIVDYQMPEMNGAQFIRKVKENYKHIKCIMLSGQANAIQVDELAEDNLLDSFISKPWDENDLKSIIKPLVESD